MSEHRPALLALRDAKLPLTVGQDLYEMYLEDCEEYSVATAMEKLEQGIADAKENG